MIPRASVGAYTFPHDYIGEGFDTVFGRLERAGLGSATVAVAYHTSRDVFPHNPLGMVQYLEGGVTYFEPNPRCYREPAPKPTEAALTKGSDFVDRYLVAAGRHGFATAAWVVGLHNTRLAMAHPDLACRTALGDRLLNSLCPANPGVRAYLVGLAEDVASRGFQGLKLETPGYMGFAHGYHHERSLIDLSPLAVVLLGICFCEHCMRAGIYLGSDAEKAKAHVAALIRGELTSSGAGDARDVEVAELCQVGDGELGRVLRARTQVVTTLLTDVVNRVREVSPSTRVSVIDASGAQLGYATGRPETPDPATSIAWRQGLDLTSVPDVCDVVVTGYLADPRRLERELESYLEVLGPQAYERMELILRPTTPDVASEGDLVEKVRVAATAGVNELGFYHYGLVRLQALDWIAVALSRQRTTMVGSHDELERGRDTSARKPRS